MKITKQQLKRIIREAVEENELLGLTGPWHEVVAEYIRRGKSAVAADMVLNKLYMGPDLWRMQEDVLEDMLIELGPDATPEQIDAVSIEFRDGVRADKWVPQTKEEMEADWARGANPRTNYSKRSR